MSQHRIGVVGGGLGGLAAACVLAARGYPVTLFERSAHVGGKAAVLRQGGYRFDMGPTILTLPSVLRRLFAEAGRDLDDELTLRRCDPQWRSFFSDGSRLDLVADRQAMARRLDAFAAGAILAMLADTMIPDAYRSAGRLAGLFTVVGFAAAFLLS